MTPATSDAVWIWCARLSWAILPVATGSAFTDALGSWSTGPARVATALLWVAWAAGLLALLAPRPWGTTVLRIDAPAAVLCVLAALTSTSLASSVLALVTTLVATVLALSAPVAAAAANSLSYGDEVRVPLRIPTPLLVFAVPIAILLAIAGIASGPIALADGNVLLGIPLLIAGVLLALVVARALHGLSTRWLVFVPAGVALVDPLTLIDPVLMRREVIAGFHRVRDFTRHADVLDLRLGTISGGVELELAEDVPFGCRRGRSDGAVVTPAKVAIAVPRPDAVVARAGARRIKTG